MSFYFSKDLTNLYFDENYKDEGNVGCGEKKWKFLDYFFIFELIYIFLY